jgi:hypothetical protein
MNELLFIDSKIGLETSATLASLGFSQMDVRVLMRETATGHWTVRDEQDRKGGIFYTRKAALAFIRREFGNDAEIVMEAAPADVTMGSVGVFSTSATLVQGNTTAH